MTTFVMAPLAEADVTEIHRYIALDRPVAALRMVQRLFLRFELIGLNPSLGRKREVGGVPVRTSVVRPFVIFYDESARPVQILRVLHGARDLSQLDFR